MKKAREFHCILYLCAGSKYLFIRANVPYFFISPEKFVFAHFWGISNEWMKKLFFFYFPVCFFFPLQKLNEWMTFELFRGKEKKNKTHKNAEKKHTQLLYKKRNFIKIWLNDRWTFPREQKKKYAFFPASRKHYFRI